MRIITEAEAISPDVQACGDNNYTSLARLQEEVPSSSRRGNSTQRGCTHSIVVAIHHCPGSGKSTSFLSSFFCRREDTGTFGEGEWANRENGCCLDPREGCVGEVSKLGSGRGCLIQNEARQPEDVNIFCKSSARRSLGGEGGKQGAVELQGSFSGIAGCRCLCEGAKQPPAMHRHRSGGLKSRHRLTEQSELMSSEGSSRGCGTLLMAGWLPYSAPGRQGSRPWSLRCRLRDLG